MRIRRSLTYRPNPSYFADGSASAPSMAFASETNLGWYRRGAGNISLALGGTPVFNVSAGEFRIDGSYAIEWASGDASTAGDLFLRRDAANTLAQRNSTNAQTFNLYGTYVDASNYERVRLSFVGGIGVLRTEKGGTGVARSLRLGTDGTSRFEIDTNGNLTSLATFATNMTNGFINVPSAAGAPSGTPGNTTGVPLYYDATNNKLYAYNGAWKGVTLA